MSELSFGVKIWGDIRNLLDSLAKGKSSVDEFGKKTSGSFKDLQKDVYRAENTFKNLAYQLGINSKEAQEALTKFRALSAESKAITQAIRPPKGGLMSDFKNELTGIATGFIGVSAVVGTTIGLFKSAVEGAMADEAATKKLTFALNGNSAATERMIRWKDMMMETTLFSEDEIMAASSLGLEMGRTEQQTKKMVETAMGLANVTGVDLNTAMLNLSATFTGNIGKLGKMAEDVKGLSDEELRNGGAIDILNAKYAKFASEGLDTTAGKVSQLKKFFGEAMDSMGAKLFDLIEGAKVGFSVVANVMGSGGMGLDKSNAKKKYDNTMKGLFAEHQAIMDNKAAEIEQGKESLKRNVYLERLAEKEKNITKEKEKQLKIDKETPSTLGEALYKYGEFIPSQRPKDETIPDKLTGIGTNNALGGGARVMTGAPGVATGVQGRTVTDMQAVTDAINEAAAALSGFGAGFQRTFAAMGQIAIKFKEGFKGKWQDTMAAFAEMAQGAVELVSGLFTASSNKRLQEFDDQYNAQRSAIENSKMSEEQKKKAIDKLDADSARKRKELQRQAAKDQKTANLFQAVIGGALAVVQAYAIPVVGMLMGTLMLGLVAAQVAAIASQPLPALASGGLAHAPTMALVGDNPNARIDPEVIAPLSKLRQYMGGDGGSGSLVAVVKGNDIHFMLQRVAKAQSRI